MSTNDSTGLDRLQHLFDRLGQRLTPQKEAVWRLFAESSQGYTLPEACRALRDEKIGQATVYRVVNLLREHGLLRYVHAADGEHRYLAGGPGHSHYLVCRSCGKACEVTDCDLSVLEKLLSVQTGFCVEGHHLEFFGLCPQCGPLPDLRRAPHSG